MEDIVVTEVDSAPPGSSRQMVRIASAAFAAALLIVAIVAITRAAATPGGAESPEQLVTEMIESLNNEDLVALATLVEPAERRTLVEPMFDMVDEMGRLNLLASDIDLSSLDGLDVEVTNFTYDIVAVPGADDLWSVLMTGGDVSMTVDGAELPLGSALTSRFGDDINELDLTESSRIDTDEGLVIVERGGRWYLSMWYSTAEAARIEAMPHEPVPSSAESPPSVGSDSPADAVEGLLDELVDVDIAGIIGRLDPEEASALYRYAPLFLADAQQQATDAIGLIRDEGYSWAISDLVLETDQDGSDATVTITDFSVSVTGPDTDVAMTYAPNGLRVLAEVSGADIDASLTMDGRTMHLVASVSDGFESFVIDALLEVTDGEVRVTGTFGEDPVWLSLEFDDFCTRYNLDVAGLDESGCIEELMSQMGLDMTMAELGIDGSITDLVGDFELPGIPVVTRKTDGAWYVSPTLSMTHMYRMQLERMEPQHVENILDFFVSLENAFGPN